MKIVVCIKQVPGTSEVEMDENGNLIRDPSNTKMNPFDLFAIESALKIKEIIQNGTTECEIVIISMGPPSAEIVIREAFMMGADRGILLTDRKFAGADVWATSYTLAQGILKDGVPDIIICGKQTTDGDTAQVGAEIAEFLDIPHITNVTKINNINSDSITIDADLPNQVQTAKLEYPCLITVEKDIYTPRLPSYRRKLLTKPWKIQKLNQNMFADKNDYHYGGKGSPTRVIKVFPPESSTDKEIWDDSPDVIAEKLFNKLLDLKFI